jgi:phosphoribosylaminoimidazole-succinocarboxamide synthase
MTENTLMETNLGGKSIAKRRGKVRDIYDLGDRLLLVATDRISAFDWVLPNGIPDKGRVLTGLSIYWFKRLEIPNHLISVEPDEFGLDLGDADRYVLEGRAMLVSKARVVPFECVVRSYLAGSAWKEYRASGTICGRMLPPGLVESSRIAPIFTPATKAESGHDENVSFETMIAALGSEVAHSLESKSLEAYRIAADRASACGLILADTKFEWGFDRSSGKLLLVDEVCTPDSSRYWSHERYQPGRPQPSFDKQFVRDWLESTGWDKASPPPALPQDVVAKTRALYIEAFERLTGQSFPWT